MFGLAAAPLPLSKLGGSGNAWIHTMLEAIAALFAFLIGGIALVRCYAQKSIPYLLLGTAFLAAGYRRDSKQWSRRRSAGVRSALPALGYLLERIHIRRLPLSCHLWKTPRAEV